MRQEEAHLNSGLAQTYVNSTQKSADFCLFVVFRSGSGSGRGEGSQPGSGLSLSALPFLWHIVKYLVNIFEALTKRNYINTRAYAEGL